MSELEFIAAALGRIEAHGVTVDGRLVAIEVRQEGMRVEQVGTNKRLDIGNERMDVANGRMSRAEAQIRALEDAARDERNIAAGEERVKLAARTRLQAIWGRVERPVMYGAGMLVFGAGVRVGAFLLGGVAW